MSSLVAPRPLWPHGDFELELVGADLPVGKTILLSVGERAGYLRVIERLGWWSWRVRPTSGRPTVLNAGYRRRQRARVKRRR